MSVSQIQAVRFQAPWPESLKPVPSTTAQKVLNVFLNIITLGLYWLVNRLIDWTIGRVILPAQSLVSPTRIQEAKRDFEEFWNPQATPSIPNCIVLRIHDLYLFEESKAKQVIQDLRSHFKPSYNSVLTPDGEEISITVLKHKDADPLTPALIHFNGNGEYSLSTSDLWPLVESINHNKPCNYVLFDYRGVGKGSFRNTNDLLVDGSSVVHWVRNHLVQSDDQIQFYGKSLGGAVAAEVQALDAEHLTGSHINQCSFSSIERMVRSHVLNKRLANLVVSIMNKRGFKLDGAAAFNKLQGPKMIVRYANDRVIPESASLQKAVNHDVFIEPVPKQEMIDLTLACHHNSALEWYEGATQQMGQFLFKTEIRQEQVV